MKTKNGVAYFFVHFAVEAVCFQYFYLYLNNLTITAMLSLSFDVLAFLPQIFWGMAVKRFPRFSSGLFGIALMLAGALVSFANAQILGLICIAVGNSFVHISGAGATLYGCKGKLSPSAIFVAGGSFGLITGRLLGNNGKTIFISLAMLAVAAVIVWLTDKQWVGKNAVRENPEIHISADRPAIIIVLLAFFVIAVRAFIGYGIPTSWNKSVIQTVYLYITMGAGKALGGILSDKFGARKIALLSSALSLPLLLLGDNLMFVSLLGVMMFSMTMSITLGILVSVFCDEPCFAFGITTVGLLLGTLTQFSAAFRNVFNNNITIIICTAAAFFALWYIMKKDGDKNA